MCFSSQWTAGAWTAAIRWYWSNFLTLRQWLHILHVAGGFIFVCIHVIAKTLFHNHLISKIFAASIPHLLPYHTEGKRVASEHRSVQSQQGIFPNVFPSIIFLEKKIQVLQMFLPSGNSFWLQCPPPLILQVSGRQKMSGKLPEGKRSLGGKWTRLIYRISRIQRVLGFQGIYSGDWVERSKLPGSDENPIRGTSPWTSPAGKCSKRYISILKTEEKY